MQARGVELCSVLSLRRGVTLSPGAVCYL